MGICIYCIDKSADTLYLEKGANRFVQAVGNISQSEINSWEHKPLVIVFGLAFGYSNEM